VKAWQKAVKAKEPFDLILMDCRMPLMDGCEAATQIRELEAHQRLDRTLVVGCSASVSEGKRRCIQAGMDDYVIKPVTLDKVKKVLQHVDMAKKEKPYQSYDRLIASGILDRLSAGLELEP
jgi:CheY-like chemotaxis protein